MIDDLIALHLIRANMAVSVAVLIVLAARRPVRQLIGPEVAYYLWMLVPVAALTSLFPSLADFLMPMQGSSFDAGLPGDMGRWASRLAHLTPFYLVGAIALLALFVASEWRFRRLAREGRVGPAVVGAAWPAIVTPHDYEQRFDGDERSLIRLHEQTHIERGHPRHNRLIVVAQLLGWCNPLVHLAAHCARLDQEIACDAAVIAAAPGRRKLYARTLLKAQQSGAWSALACALTNGGRHPLEVRIQALKTPPLSLRKYLTGVGAIAALGAAIALCLWTLAPQTYG